MLLSSPQEVGIVASKLTSELLSREVSAAAARLGLVIACYCVQCSSLRRKVKGT